MKTLMLPAALVAAAMFIATPVLGQGTKDCDNQPSAAAKGSAPKASAPEKIEGEVTTVDPQTGMLTVKRPDGTTHQFRGSAETVKEYKPGDRIELTLRAQPC